MSPIGGFTSALLGTLLGGRNKSSSCNSNGGGGGGKKYEKLETDDPAERKRQEATHEEIQRLNFKIVSQSESQPNFTRSPASRGFEGKSIRAGGKGSRISETALSRTSSRFKWQL